VNDLRETSSSRGCLFGGRDHASSSVFRDGKWTKLIESSFRELGGLKNRISESIGVKTGPRFGRPSASRESLGDRETTRGLSSLNPLANLYRRMYHECIRASEPIPWHSLNQAPLISGNQPKGKFGSEACDKSWPHVLVKVGKIRLSGITRNEQADSSNLKKENKGHGSFIKCDRSDAFSRQTSVFYYPSHLNSTLHEEKLRGTTSDIIQVSQTLDVLSQFTGESSTPQSLHPDPPNHLLRVGSLDS